MLAAPDETAFVRLAWFWAGRYAEMSTVLPDGRLVTTSTDWGIDPAWPRQIRRWYAATTDRHREQSLWLSPSCSARIVDGPAAELWSAHRAHVVDLSGDGAAPSGHRTLEDAIAVYDAGQTSRMRSNARAQRLSQLAGFLVACALLVPLTVMLRPGFATSVAMIGAGWLLWVVVQKQLWLRARHWRWLRPRFRAPVPQAGASPADPDD